MATIKDQLILHEGFKLKPYLDTVGKWTLGIGRNITDKGITGQEALFLLETDLKECEEDLATFSWYKGLDPIRKRVVLDMRFNLGAKGFRLFKGTIKSISEGRYEDAARGMMASKWAKQTKTRAIRLAKMMRTGLDYDDPNFKEI